MGPEFALLPSRCFGGYIDESTAGITFFSERPSTGVFFEEPKCIPVADVHARVSRRVPLTPSNK